MKKIQFLNAFHLKIIAMIIMVIDHFTAYIIPFSSSLYYPLRYLGRIAFPIFAFLVVEGIHYSKKPINYLLRLLSLGIIIDIFTYIFLHSYDGGVLITFFFGGTIVYCLEHLKKYYKLLFLIPLTLSILANFTFFPLKMQYGLYGIITILIFYISKLIAKYCSKLIFNCEIDDDIYRLFYSLICSSLFIVFNMLCVLFRNDLYTIFTANDVDFIAQSYSVFACIFIILYNGKRGYNAKWFQYGCYLFFPLQFVLIYLIKIIFFS